MLSKKIWVSIASLGLLLGVASGVKAAEMPVHTSIQNNQFHRIEQPLSLKVAVTIGGLGLIGLELWWFLLSEVSITPSHDQSESPVK